MKNLYPPGSNGAISFAMAHTEPDPDFDPGIEADLEAEQSTGKATRYKTTAAAIAAMEKRVAYLQQLADRAVHPERILKELRQAQSDLDGYRRQHEGRN